MNRRHLYKNEKRVRVVSPMGLLMGEFITTVSTLPQLVAINKSPLGQSYFRWSGIKKEEL